MFSNKHETEEDFENPSSYETMSVTSSSSSSGYESQGSSKNGVPEVRKKVMKLRSMKFSRLPSLKLITRQIKIQPDFSSPYSSTDPTTTTSSQQSTPLKMMLESSPNYMKTTTSADAKKEMNSQKPAKTVIKRSSFRSAKSLTRLSSTKFRRPPLVRRSSGGADLKKKLKKVRSIKITNRESAVSQASSKNAPSSLNSNGKKSSSSNLKMNLVSSGNKPMRGITRTSSLRPARMLTKMASLRTRRLSSKRSSQVPDSSTYRATCSSSLKDSKFPDHLEVQEGGGSESEVVSAMKVCPYSYCSLHGHRHSTLPPLKRFVSMRRRQLKTQKGAKLERQTSQRARRFAGTIAALDHHCKSLVTVDHPEITDFKSQGQKDPGLCNDLPLNGLVSACHEETQAAGVFNQDFGQDSFSSLNINMCQGQSESNTSDANTSRDVADESSDESRSLFSDRHAESKATTDIVSFASAAKDGNNAGIEEDCQLVTADSGADCATNVVNNTPLEKQKHMGLWRLIYHHMASGSDAEDESQRRHDEVEDEEQGKDTNVVVTNKSEPCPDSAETDKSTDMEDHERCSPDIRFYQYDAIKVVREAFDKLLSEIPDQSSDDQSVNSDTVSDKELSENNLVESTEFSVSSSSESRKDSTVQDLESMKLDADHPNDSKEEKPAAKMGNKANQNTLKNWSNLKKVIIFKRFVKALEKVRNINPRKPRFVPAKPDPETERIHLRRQTMGGRKNSEEWMLDYALQQVITTLAPAQKRKVALLVEAFETVAPLPETDAHPRFDIAAASCATPVQFCNAAPDQKGPEKGRDSIFRISLRKTPSVDSSIKGNQEHAGDAQADEEQGFERESTAPDNLASETIAKGTEEEVAALDHANGDNNPISRDVQCQVVEFSVEIVEPKLHDRPSPMAFDVQRSSCEELLVHGEALQEVPREESMISASEVCDLDYDRASPVPDSHEEPSEAAGEDTKLKKMLEKQKHMRLWYMIYKHMVSGTTKLLEEADKDEQGDESNASVGTNNDTSQDDCTAKDHDVNLENHNAGDRKIELREIEAMRLVEEAIDEIPLPENQDHSLDNESVVVSDMTLDEEEQEKNPDDIKDDEKGKKTTMEIGNETGPPMRKSWSNLKKLILLKRFIKSLEKVKKFSPKEPRFLPLEPDKVAEKVHLRHQDIEDRKNADEWMLDYTLQQVVAKLTPARKRKVALLVEAFETVIPTIRS